jgi:hypothetical protein
MKRAGRVPIRLTNRYSDREREFEFVKSLLGLEPRVPHHSGAVVFMGELSCDANIGTTQLA